MNIVIILPCCIDMIKRRNLRTQNIKVFILDEADEMLNQGTRVLVACLSVVRSSLVGSASCVYRISRTDL